MQSSKTAKDLAAFLGAPWCRQRMRAIWAAVRTPPLLASLIESSVTAFT